MGGEVDVGAVDDHQHVAFLHRLAFLHGLVHHAAAYGVEGHFHLLRRQDAFLLFQCHRHRVAAAVKKRQPRDEKQRQQSDSDFCRPV